jgi:hypothetical protein
MYPVLVMALLLAGLVACKKQAAVPTPPAGAGVSAHGPLVVSPFTEPVVVADSGDVNATLGQLSQALRTYSAATRSAPMNFAEFADKIQLQAPPPPAGKQYAISKGMVVLVNR